jgi:hypothetical protein
MTLAGPPSRGEQDLSVARKSPRHKPPGHHTIEKIQDNDDEESTAFMANTTKLTKEERKKSKRASRKKRKAEKPLKPRDYARGSKKPKVKKLARGQAKR